MTTVRPSEVISRISSSTAWDDSGSRPEVGSSNSSSSGSCRTSGPGPVGSSCPSSSRRPAASRASAMPKRSAAAPMRASHVAGHAVELGGVGQVVAARSVGRRAPAWPTRPRSGGGPGGRPRSGSSPKVRTVPPSGARAPVIARMAVVLPAPFGPEQHGDPPGRDLEGAGPCSASTAPKRCPIPWIVTNGPGRGRVRGSGGGVGRCRWARWRRRRVGGIRCRYRRSGPSCRDEAHPGVASARLHPPLRAGPSLRSNLCSSSAWTPACHGVATASCSVGRPPPPRRCARACCAPTPPSRCPTAWPSCRSDVRRLLDEFSPVAVAVERVLFQVNVRTAMSVGQASGVVMAEAAGRGMAWSEYSPEPGQGRRGRPRRRRQGAGAAHGADPARPRRRRPTRPTRPTPRRSR